ncbi:hypothetical protein J1N35_014267 [Gossypium stocksii]|uniref:Uncharacterized protein n=1 Tax=Gossypium stocksii TaxID=47602 RepID=A0A9D3VVF8_9ROSI|nr:hypothetical protein J1N35_014267 [Gossypium stocksii]
MEVERLWLPLTLFLWKHLYVSPWKILENFLELPPGDITKIIGKGFSSNLIFPFGTYLSYIFTRINIPTHVDPPVSIKLQPISLVGLYRVGFKLNPFTGNCIKDDQPNPQEVDDKDNEDEHDKVPPPKPAPIYAISSTPTQEKTILVNMLAILGVIRSLLDDFRGLDNKVYRMEEI